MLDKSEESSHPMNNTHYTPTVVSIYELDLREWYRVAEFRLTTKDSVELTLFSDSNCPLALHWYRHGIETPATEPLVTCANGPEFMRALLRPFQMSYCQLVDESPGRTNVSESVTPQWWQYPALHTP
ncbi:hypothetical protein ACFVUS_27115 [Nocardia sp. NPDC058058]|uniref:hypothetical protein n=1 Tax=Nocardia sp. NPDC058058 TaxID=3346317 RepID=UPI0036DEA5CF